MHCDAKFERVKQHEKKSGGKFMRSDEYADSGATQWKHLLYHLTFSFALSHSLTSLHIAAHIYLRFLPTTKKKEKHTKEMK